MRRAENASLTLGTQPRSGSTGWRSCLPFSPSVMLLALTQPSAHIPLRATEYNGRNAAPMLALCPYSCAGVRSIKASPGTLESLDKVAEMEAQDFYLEACVRYRTLSASSLDVTDAMALIVPHTIR